MISILAQDGPIQVELVNTTSNFPLVVIAALSAIVSAIALVVAIRTANTAQADRKLEATAREQAQSELRVVREQARVETMMHLHAVSVVLVSEWQGIAKPGHHQDVQCSIVNTSQWPITNVDIYVMHPLIDYSMTNDAEKMTRLAHTDSANPGDGGSWSGEFSIALLDGEPIPMSRELSPPAALFFTDKFGNRWQRNSDGSLNLVKSLPVTTVATSPATTS